MNGDEASGPETTGPSADRDALAVAVLALHDALDGWAAAVQAAAEASPGDAEAAVESPALGAAEDAWDEAFDAFHGAAGRALGVEDEPDEADADADPADPADAVGVELYATVTGAGEGEPLLIVDAEGERVVAALEAAGFEVPEWGVQLVPVEDLADDADLDDDLGDDDPSDDPGERDGA